MEPDLCAEAWPDADSERRQFELEPHDGLEPASPPNGTGALDTDSTAGAWAARVAALGTV
jgi:hypothetical protein